LKKKLQGLNELKEVVKTLTYGSLRNKKIVCNLLILDLMDKGEKDFRKSVFGQ
jgi:hypothetical protein